MSDWITEQTNFTVLRTPLLSEDTIDVLQNNNAHVSTDDSIKNSLRELIKISQQQDVVQAIKFASPSLAEKIFELTDDLTVDNLKLASSIYKYIARMSTRCTPFGAFSSVMTLPNADKTHIDINPKMRLFLRLDNSCVIDIAKIAEDQAIKQQNLKLKIRKNTSLYKIADEFRFVARSVVDKHNDFKLDSVKFSEAIDQALGLSNCWLDIESLANILSATYPEVDIQQLIGFIFNLLDNQLLENNLTVVVSAKNSLYQLSKRAIDSNIDFNLIEKMQTILRLLESITLIDDKALTEKLNSVKTILNEIIPEHGLKKWLHVDSFRDAGNQSYGADKITPIVDTFNKLADFLWKPSQGIIDFTKKFESRYSDSEVSLLEALDVDSGITFGQPRGGRSPLLNGIMPMNKLAAHNSSWQELDKLVLTKVIDAISNNQHVAKISIEEIEKYKTHTSKPNIRYEDSFSIQGTVLKEEEEGEPSLFNLQGINGPSALMLLGRFSCGDNNLLTACKKIAEQEQHNSDAIYAEIVHIPQAVIANISCRPSIRKYEIIYGLGDSGLADEYQIRCEDLFLKLVKGRLCLFSKKLNKEIKPRLASAHNTSGLNLPVYQFLHALQGVDGYISNIPINSVINSLPYLPEIRVDNLIISQRRWLLTVEEIQKLQKCKSNKGKIACLNKYKIEKNISRYVALSEGDNVLEFDLEVAFSALIFINEIIKRKTTIKIIQSLKGRTDNDVQHKGNIYRHELVIPCFIKNNIKQKPTIDLNKLTLNVKQQRNFTSMPGENWKYLKIYTGEASADKLLHEYISLIANKLVASNKIENWHFIRYQDPEFHLRVRFKLNDSYTTDAISKDILSSLKPLYTHGLIHRISEESHEPEIQRYGGSEILPICEQLFYLNSVIITDYIGSTFSHIDKDELRWSMCLRLAWQLTLEVTGSLAKAEQFYKSTASSYDQEFGGSNKHTKTKLSENYRVSMQKVAQALRPDFSTSNSTFINQEIYPQYQECLNLLKQQCQTHNQDVLQIVQSLIHMDCNRTFVINPRANEWVLYQYLARYCRTAIARKFTLGLDVLGGIGAKKEQKKQIKKVSVLEEL